MSEVPAGFPRVAKLFLGFGVLACLVVVLGLALALFEGAALRAFEWPAPQRLAGDLGRLSSEGVLGLGLLLLLLLPLVRNGAVILATLRRGQRLPALLAFAVLLMLLALYAFLSVPSVLASGG